MAQIQEALKNDLTKFLFEGKDIRIDPRTGIFITMNPGYAGRTELPDNLKVGGGGRGMKRRVMRLGLWRRMLFDLSLSHTSHHHHVLLPPPLQALFRPVTMVVPDLEQICEIMLFSEGFDSAKMLAKKMTVLYKLSREQLSKQVWTWGGVNKQSLRRGAEISPF